MELSLGLVLFAIFRGAFYERQEGFVLDFLEDFTSTLLAAVGIDNQERLDIGDTRYDTTHSKELADMLSLELTDSKAGFVRQRLK